MHTVNIPYDARLAKMNEDEKNIYRFGFGLDINALKDTNATTNVAIKSAYAGLELKANNLIIRLKQFMRRLLKIVLKEINEKEDTGYTQKDVYFKFKPEVMTNAQENASIELIEAQKMQVELNT